MRPDGPHAPGSRWPGRRDLGACLVGLLLSVATMAAVCALSGWARWEECSGEYRPFLGSAKQFFAIRGCLARDAGPLIAVKKRLGIYDMHWRPVIE